LASGDEVEFLLGQFDHNFHFYPTFQRDAEQFRKVLQFRCPAYSVLTIEKLGTQSPKCLIFWTMHQPLASATIPPKRKAQEGRNWKPHSYNLQDRKATLKCEREGGFALQAAAIARELAGFIWAIARRVPPAAG
jgi:hypothetical protein